MQLASRQLTITTGCAFAAQAPHLSIYGDNYWALISSQEAEEIWETIASRQTGLSLCTVNNSSVSTTLKLKGECLKRCPTKKNTLSRVTDGCFGMTDSRTLASCTMLIIATATAGGPLWARPIQTLLHQVSHGPLTETGS